MSFVCLEMFSRISYSFTFPGTGVCSDVYFPPVIGHFLLLPWLSTFSRVILQWHPWAFFALKGTSHQGLWTYKCPVFPELILFHQEDVLFPSSFSGLWNWGLLKAEAKKASSASIFSPPHVTSSSVSFSSRLTFSLVFLLSYVCFYKPFLLSLTFLSRFNSI